MLTNPIAIVSGFFSGFASSTSFLMLLVDPSSAVTEDGISRLSKEIRRAGFGAISVDSPWRD
jgi:hypothetical protein